MMPDNWAFVIAAYGLAAVVLIAYWRFLSRREKELDDAGAVRQDLRGHRQPNPASERPSP
jgi:membrane protein implicated in regulation of membrane protease activity